MNTFNDLLDIVKYITFTDIKRWSKVIVVSILCIFCIIGWSNWLSLRSQLSRVYTENEKLFLESQGIAVANIETQRHLNQSLDSLRKQNKTLDNELKKLKSVQSKPVVIINGNTNGTIDPNVPVINSPECVLTIKDSIRTQLDLVLSKTEHNNYILNGTTQTFRQNNTALTTQLPIDKKTLKLTISDKLVPLIPTPSWGYGLGLGYFNQAPSANIILSPPQFTIYKLQIEFIGILGLNRNLIFNGLIGTIIR
jgi:hypothetical protein